MFYKEGNTSFLASWTVVSNSIITWNSEIDFFGKERFIKSNNVNWVFI